MNHYKLYECKVTDLEKWIVFSYDSILNLVNNNISHFNSINIEKLKLENERLQLLLQSKESGVNCNRTCKWNKIFKKWSTRIKIKSTIKQIFEKLDIPKTTNNFNEQLQTLGDRVQKINPDTFELVKVYESMNQILSENIEIKRSSLSKSINEYTVYHGFRWNFVPRNMDSIIVDIQPTKNIIIKNTGYIAKLNKEKTHYKCLFR